MFVYVYIYFFFFSPRKTFSLFKCSLVGHNWKCEPPFPKEASANVEGKGRAFTGVCGRANLDLAFDVGNPWDEGMDQGSHQPSHPVGPSCMHITERGWGDSKDPDN